MKHEDTFFLVRALKSGDRASLERLYKLYYSKLYWFCTQFRSTTLEPDDFVQQTFLKLWENRAQLKEDVLFDKQMFFICKNMILNHIKRENKFEVPDRKYTFKAEEETEDPEEESLKLKKLNSLLQKLPKKRKEIFLLHKIENLTYEEIAVFFSISKKTIAQHIYLANDFLKKESRKN